jgi:hypothetical protein
MTNMFRAALFIAMTAPIGFAACAGEGGPAETEEQAPENVETRAEAVGSCNAECWCGEYGYCTFRVEGGPEGCGEAGLACCNQLNNCDDVPKECPWGPEYTCDSDWDCGYPWNWDCAGGCCVNAWGS